MPAPPRLTPHRVRSPIRLTHDQGETLPVYQPHGPREECGVIESVKAAADIYAPVAGEVVAANTELADAPEKVNQDPYGAWMFRIRPDDPAELASLLDAAAYRKMAEVEKH